MPSAVQNLSEDLAMLKREASVYVEELARNECLLDFEGQKVGGDTDGSGGGGGGDGMVLKSRRESGSLWAFFRVSS